MQLGRAAHGGGHEGSFGTFDTYPQSFHNKGMARRQRFSLNYDQATKDQLRAIHVKFHSLIRTVIEEQLVFEPENETRNRKPLRQPAPFEATWELRFGPANRFRVLYGVDHERREVQIQAIGVKMGNRLLIAGEEVEL